MDESCELSSDYNRTAGQFLPAQRVDSAGRVHVDQRAIWALAFPLMVSSAVQVVLNLIDLWFIGRLSTNALAAVGAVQWPTIVVVLVLGGAGMAVHPVVAQAYGARRYTKASQAVWTALWATLCMMPLAIAVAAEGHLFLAPFGFDPQIETLASQFWFPRVLGSPLGAAVGAMLGYFNGIGRTRVTLLVTVLVAIVNAIFNQLFIFQLGWGIAGSGWATNVAQAVGLLLALGVFLNADHRRKYNSHLTSRPRVARMWYQWRLGLLMSLLPALDILGLWIFQMMQVRLGAVAGAATQVVSVLTSIGYIPGFGIASAGTTLVGHSLGAGDRLWARQVGTRVILLTALYTGVLGVILAAAGPLLLPLFVDGHDAEAAAVIALGTELLWFAAGYLFFDGLNLGSASCLRAAGDAFVPASLVLAMSWLVFLPLAHSFTFLPNQGWFDFLPQFGWGSIGGWSAVLIYMLLLGSILALRWYWGAWELRGSKSLTW
jgi:multidrug resistance protein, MATE family